VYSILYCVEIMVFNRVNKASDFVYYVVSLILYIYVTLYIKATTKGNQPKTNI